MCCVKREQRRGESEWASCFSFLSPETSPRGEGNGDRVSRRVSSTKRRCLSWWLSSTDDSLPLRVSPRRRRIGSAFCFSFLSLETSRRGEENGDHVSLRVSSTADSLSLRGSPRRRRIGSLCGSPRIER